MPDGFGVPLNVFGEMVSVDGMLESLVDGVLLRGTVSAQVDQQCASCLEDLPTGKVVAEVADLFTEPSDDVADDEREPGYEITDTMIDIETSIRDALAQATPHAPKCRSDCSGLCPSCGTNLNNATCECGDVVTDARWSVLSDLKLNP